MRETPSNMDAGVRNASTAHTTTSQTGLPETLLVGEGGPRPETTSATSYKDGIQVLQRDRGDNIRDVNMPAGPVVRGNQGFPA